MWCALNSPTLWGGGRERGNICPILPVGAVGVWTSPSAIRRKAYILQGNICARYKSKPRFQSIGLTN